MGGVQFGTVDSRLRVRPTPPHQPGVYLFLNASDQVMYVGMAHDLEKVLYRYQQLQGRQAMRDRAAAGQIAQVGWVACKSGMTPPSLEQLAIRRYRPPWNTQHNPEPRGEGQAVRLSDAEQAWLRAAASKLDTTLQALADAKPPAAGPTPRRRGWLRSRRDASAPADAD